MEMRNAFRRSPSPHPLDEQEHHNKNEKTVYTEEQGKLDTPLMEKVYLTQKRGRNNPQETKEGTLEEGFQAGV